MTYTAVILPNPTDAAHLAVVTAEMVTLGAPVIRCSIDEAQGLLVALEGSHRIAAAYALGIMPLFVVLDDTDELTAAELGWDDMDWFEGEPATVAAIRERMGEPMGTYHNAPILNFGEAWADAHEPA